MLHLPEKCMRARTDCQPLANIVSDEEPITFICCGENDGKTRVYEQDKYRICIKDSDSNGTMQDVDKRDIIDEMSVLAQALSIIENKQSMPPLLKALSSTKNSSNYRDNVTSSSMKALFTKI